MLIGSIYSWVRFVAVRIFSIALLTSLTAAARADGPPRPPDDPLFFSPPVSLSTRCGPLGGCALFDDISLKIGTIGVVRGKNDSRFAALSGLVHAAISLRDLAELGGAFGGHLTHDEAGTFHSASMPAIVYGRLRIYPWLWRKLAGSGGLQLAIAYQRSFVSEKLGSQEAPGIATNRVSLLASRSLGPVDLDAGVAAEVGDNLRRAVMIHGSAALRLFGLARPIAPDEQLRIVLQTAYRWPLPGDPSPTDGYVLFGLEFQTHSGYRFGVAAGPYLLGSLVGGMGIVTWSVAWGPRYRNPLAEYIASRPPWIPKIWMDLWHVDPVLEADGCVYTDPSPVISRRIIKCVGKPDPKDPATILLDNGRRLAAGTHLWIRNDGVLITNRQEEVAQLDAQTAKEAIASQLLIHKLTEQGATPCKSPTSTAPEGLDPGVASMILNDDQGAAGLYELGASWYRATFCGDVDLLSGGIPLPPLGKGLRGQVRYRGTKIGHGEAQHTQPVKPPVSDNLRSHVFYGEVDPKKGRSTGWHHRPSGDPNKGTHVIEGTESPKDKHGVYEANVKVEGIPKNARSSFFPDEWSQGKVEKAIEEAYANRQLDHRSGNYYGYSSDGIKIEMRLDGKGRIMTAFPLYGEGQ